jgi:hypothetical protein
MLLWNEASALVFNVTSKVHTTKSSAKPTSNDARQTTGRWAQSLEIKIKSTHPITHIASFPVGKRVHRPFG